MQISARAKAGAKAGALWEHYISALTNFYCSNGDRITSGVKCLASLVCRHGRAYTTTNISLLSTKMTNVRSAMPLALAQ